MLHEGARIDLVLVSSLLKLLRGELIGEGVESSFDVLTSFFVGDTSATTHD
jgi:hypothetical protein